MRKIALMILLGFGFAVLPAVAQDDDIIEYVEEVEYDDSAEGAGDESVSVTSDESSEVAESGDKTSQSAEIAEVTSESTQDSRQVAESSAASDETKEVASDESTTEATESADESKEVVEADTEATAEVAESSVEAEEATEDAQLEVLDEEEFANGDDSEYVDSEEEVVEAEADAIDNYDNTLGGEADYTYSTSDDKSDITRWNYTEKEIVKKEKIRQRQAEREAEYEKSISRRRSGLFFGVGMGFSDTTIKGLADSFTGSLMGDGMSVMGIGIGAFAGWQIAFNEYAGVRMYGEFDYNLGKGIILAKVGDETIKADNNLWKALGNVDFYLEGSMGRNQTETLGVFLGLGAGYIYYKGGSGRNDAGQDVTWKSLHMIGFVVNYGIHTILGTNHRIELFVRNYPFVRVESTTTNYRNSDFTANMDAWLRYSYMF